MYAIVVRCHHNLRRKITRSYLFGQRLVRRQKNIRLSPIIFTGLVSPTGAIIREQASEEEAVNAMKWKQLKEGEREKGAPDGAEHVRLSLPLLAGPAVINLSKTQQYNRAMKKAPRTR